MPIMLAIDASGHFWKPSISSCHEQKAECGIRVLHCFATCQATENTQMKGAVCGDANFTSQMVDTV